MTVAEDKERGVLTVNVNYEITGQYVFGAIQFLEKTKVDLKSTSLITDEIENHIDKSVWFLKQLAQDLEAAVLKKKFKKIKGFVVLSTYIVKLDLSTGTQKRHFCRFASCLYLYPLIFGSSLLKILCVCWHFS